MIATNLHKQLTDLSTSSLRIQCLYINYGNVTVSEDQLNIPVDIGNTLQRQVSSQDKLAVVVLSDRGFNKQYAIVNCERHEPELSKQYVAIKNSQWDVVIGGAITPGANIIGEIVQVIKHG
jgi:hypothetical protein